MLKLCPADCVSLQCYGQYKLCIIASLKLTSLKIGSILLQRDYEEFRVRINALVAKAQKKPDEGWTMQDGRPWPGNDSKDHTGMIQVNVAYS